MFDTHVYEADDKVLFRRTGNLSRLIVPCVVVRTHDITWPTKGENGQTQVKVGVLVTGYYSLEFTEEFPVELVEAIKASWRSYGGGNFQAGPQIEVAVPERDYSIMMAEGRMPLQGPIFAPGYGQPSHRYGQIQSPIAAVRLTPNGQWIEPLPGPMTMRKPMM